MATILVVDSRKADRQPLTQLLGHHGHRVLEAASGERALEIARSERPDLVLTDAQLTDMGGCQLVMRLRSQSGVPRPRFVLRAARLEADLQAMARACGVEHFVTPPAEGDSLIGVIDAALAARAFPSPDARASAGAESHTLKPLVRRLRHRIAELEGVAHQLSERIELYVEQLESARAALEEEVNKRIVAERELTQMAVRDPLTGLHNRGYLEESLLREERRARRSGQPIGVMMMDIDHFKRCNDTFGHAAGDAVLRAVAHFVQSLARAEDIFCRYGGEEFVLVMVNTSPRAVLERAEILRSGVRTLRIEHEGRELGPVTLSIGIGMVPDHAVRGHEALRAADKALYRAKQAGRDRVVMGERGEA